MNTTINSILDHRFIRSYTRQMVEDDKLDVILKCTQAAPSSINGQQMSVIVIKDLETKNMMSEISGGQPWIKEAPIFLLFVADFYRAKLACDKYGEELVITDNMEGTLVGSIDVGLAMGNSIAAAESLGLGTVCIGGLRMNPEKVIELLNLPEYVYPMVGLCVGYPNKDKIPNKKPRFHQDAVIHREKYNRELDGYLEEYDKTIVDYMTMRGKDNEVHNWSGFISSVYSKVYFPKVSGTLRSQKFKCE